MISGDFDYNTVNKYSKTQMILGYPGNTQLASDCPENIIIRSLSDGAQRIILPSTHDGGYGTTINIWASISAYYSGRVMIVQKPSSDLYLSMVTSNGGIGNLTTAAEFVITQSDQYTYSATYVDYNDNCKWIISRRSMT